MAVAVQTNGMRWPAGERPDRDGILSGQKTEDAFVVGLGGVAMEGARLVLVADLECVGDLADAPRTVTCAARPKRVRMSA